MEVWGFMEMIHSRSYTYIIKNIYSDPSEVFDHIVTDQHILERARSVTEAYNDFIQGAHQYDNGIMWELAAEGHYSGQTERYELRRQTPEEKRDNFINKIIQQQDDVRLCRSNP